MNDNTSKRGATWDLLNSSEEGLRILKKYSITKEVLDQIDKEVENNKKPQKPLGGTCFGPNIFK